MNREKWLEQQMDSEDFDMSLFDAYTKELNDIQAARNASKAKRDLELKAIRQEQEQQALQDKLLSITDSEVDQMYSDFHILNAGQLDANGRTFAEWFDQALDLYTINIVGNEVHLTSKAKGEVEHTWTDLVSVAHARSKILDLIKIKFRDHHNRPDREGCDFKYIPQS